MLNEIIHVKKINEVYFRIECSPSQALELKGHLQCKSPGYLYHPRYRARVWDGNISFFDCRNHLLPIGLLYEFFNYCKKFEYEYVLDFDVSQFCNDINEEQLLEYTNALFDGFNITPRDYQIKAIMRALRNKRGTLVSATGSGKSLIIYTVIRFIVHQNMKMLLIVPNTSLVEQMFSDFASYGWDYSNMKNSLDILYSGKNPDFSKQVLISTWQSVHKKKEGFFQNFDALLVDECHGAKSFAVQSIGKKCTNAHYRLGFTGTLPTERSDILNIYGFLGPKIFELKAMELIDKGVLSKIKIANILLAYPDDIIKKNKSRIYDEEVNTIMEYQGRNKVFNYIFDNIPDKQNTLLLCHRIEHLKSICQYLESTLDPKYKVYVIYGQIKPEEREKIRNLMEISDNVILVGTYATMSTGINIRKINNIIFGSSYKSKIKILQSAGRGLRKCPGKDMLIIFDLVDDMRWKKRTGTIGKNHTFLHFEERLKYYKEQGFKFHNKQFKI